MLWRAFTLWGMCWKPDSRHPTALLMEVLRILSSLPDDSSTIASLQLRKLDILETVFSLSEINVLADCICLPDSGSITRNCIIISLHNCKAVNRENYEVDLNLLEEVKQALKVGRFFVYMLYLRINYWNRSRANLWFRQESYYFKI